MTKEVHLKRLIHILKRSYSGERAAALAYRRHWKSVKNHKEREMILKIENDEWAHREEVGKILSALSSGPQRRREVFSWWIGRLIGIFCHLTGWFFPVYIAGRVESKNVAEYLRAADHARNLKIMEYEETLLKMAKMEKEHQNFFLKTASQH